MGELRMIGLTLASLVLLAPAAAAQQVGTVDLVLTARARAERCHIAGALAGMDQALAAGRKELNARASDLLAIHQDIATYANRLFDHRRAERSARIAVDLATELYGSDSIEQAMVSQNLAIALAGMGSRAEAARLFERIVPRLAAGADRAAAANAALAYSRFENDAGRPASGLKHAQSAARIVRTADVPPVLRIEVLIGLADAQRRVLAFDEAMAAAEEATQALRVTTGEVDSPRLALVHAAIAYEQGQLTRSLELVEAIEKADLPFDPCDPTLKADVAHRRGTLHMIRRELPEAEAAFSGALGALGTRELGGDPRQGEIVYGLAVIVGMSRDADRAAALFDTAAAAFRKAYGDSSEAEAQTLMEKALVLGEAGRTGEAVATARAALDILEGLVEQAPLALTYARASLGLVLHRAGDLAAAQEELGLALAAFRDARGSESFDLAPGLGALGEIALRQGDPVGAERYFRSALAIQQRWGGDSALALGMTLSHLAVARAAQGARYDALDRSAEAMEILRRRLAIGEARPWNDVQAERAAARSILTRDLAMMVEGTEPGEVVRGAPAERMLVASQLANAASTGGAIAQMTTRLQAASPALGRLLGERNDLSAEWRAIQDDLVDGLARSGDGGDLRRDALLRRQQQAAARIDTLDRELAILDPKLDLLIKSRVVTPEELQDALRPGEAVIAFTVADEATFAVVVKRDGVAAFRSALGRDEAVAIVNGLRASLDRARWTTRQPPSYDTAGAYRLFADLIAPAGDFVGDADTLVVVTDGPLATIPFTVLLTEPSQSVSGKDHAKLPWLVRRFAVVNYPSIASIVALRAVEPRRAQHTAMLGVGDASFSGTGSGSGQPTAILRGLSRTGLADVELVRGLRPLPATRQELERIADSLGSANATLLLSTDANERKVRAMPLEEYGVIVFATHAMVAGELAGYAEPALALTPPAVASAQDDGLLSASEIALLRMRADWVILSACNTAADDGSPRAEPLSGLAKSFFYAGARSLLVTHWPAQSDAAAIITPAAVRLTANGETPAQALRKTMIAFIDDRESWLFDGHPSDWAAFNLIGSGLPANDGLNALSLDARF